MSDVSLGRLGDFLRSRRARIQPEDVGLPVFGRRRRVPGLRREEVAQLAGVSVDYYIRLEQGRGHNASDTVLDAVARVLRLDRTEREHLLDLARPSRVADTPTQTPARPGVRVLLDMIDTPAFVLGRCMDVLAWNAPADAVIGFSAMAPGARNMVRHAFLDPAARARYPDWAAVAADTVAYLRLEAARHPDDGRMAALVEELSAGDATFRRLWEEHQVTEKTYGTKLLCHPEVGEFEVGYETLTLPGDADQLIVVYTAVPGSVAARKLAALTGDAGGPAPLSDAVASGTASASV
ncbi:helix-turn-helix transcriptional regulator [Streptosporangium sp. CA-135522]|uniref:helix-turn-helix transcriptional regulator n=1 Tax=Streptosporangium sp. CA-135522 TaxID=3240072 RepID=UPI003D8AF8A9